MLRFGIDLGGTKIELIVINEDGKELYRQRCATPQGQYQAILACIGNLIQKAEQHTGKADHIGIGTPGSVSLNNGRIKNSNSTCLNNMPLQHDLEQTLKRPIQLSNDANCFVLSEATDGVGSGVSTVFGVILGTGAGAGISINGKILTGANRIAGEWGHNPLPWPNADELPGPKCYCGLRGCIETFLSGPGMSQDHQNRHDDLLQPADIVTRAAHHDLACEQTLQIYEDRLARALALVINILDPGVIVLGGGLSKIERFYANVPSHWQNYVFSDTVVTRLLPPKYGDASGVRGAAWL